jgi:hypothetical protein
VIVRGFASNYSKNFIRISQIGLKQMGMASIEGIQLGIGMIAKGKEQVGKYDHF